MTSKLKILGLALAATLALGATAASPALAQYQLHSGSESGMTYLTAEQVESTFFDLPSGSIGCSEVGGEGVYSGTTNAAGEVTGAFFSGCFAFGLQTHIDVMGCDFLITGSGATTGIVHIVCPTTGGGITDEITVTPTQGGAAICHINVPEQTATLKIGNKGGSPDDISNSIAAGSTLTYTVERTAGGSKCPTNGHHNDATLTNNITVKAFEDEGHEEPVGLTYE